MQSPARFALALATLTTLAACAEAPTAPDLTALGKSSNAKPTTGGDGGSGGTTSIDLGWKLEKRVIAIWGGTERDMILEPSTSTTDIPGGAVKWIEYEIVATKLRPDAPDIVVNEGLSQACQNIWPMVQCTWGVLLGQWTFTETGAVHVMVDLHNMFVCGQLLPFTNTATMRAKNGTSLGPVAGTVAATVNVTTGDCAPREGCTLTQGYWKQSHHAWPAHPLFSGTTLRDWPFHDSWFFFDSRKSWQQMLDTPTRGDPYYILAHQYIAAVLNQANGAPVPSAVRETLVKAYNYFASSPEVRATVSRAALIAWKDILGSYNEGRLGVRHCR